MTVQGATRGYTVNLFIIASETKMRRNEGMAEKEQNFQREKWFKEGLRKLDRDICKIDSTSNQVNQKAGEKSVRWCL